MYNFHFTRIYIQCLLVRQKKNICLLSPGMLFIAGTWIFSGPECMHACGAHLKNQKDGNRIACRAYFFKFAFEWSNAHWGSRPSTYYSTLWSSLMIAVYFIFLTLVSEKICTYISHTVIWSCIIFSFSIMFIWKSLVVNPSFCLVVCIEVYNNKHTPPHSYWNSQHSIV